MSDHIVVTNRLAHQLHDETWQSLQEAPNDILSELMPKAISNGTITRIEWPTTSAMALALSRIAAFVKVDKKGNEFDTTPPGSLVRSILEQWKVENEGAAVDAVKRLYGA